MVYGLYFGKDFSIINIKLPPPLLLPKQIAATEKGDVYVVWVDKNSTSGDSDIKFISSNDSGRTFNLGKEISGGDLLSFSPQIAATEKGDVYVVWVDKNSTSGDSDIKFISSNDSGRTFNLGKEISGGDLLSFSPQIAATEKGDVYVVWVDKNSTSGDSDIKFISSNDSGRTFNLGKEISGGDLLSFSPQIAATEKGDVYVVWVDKNSTSGDSDIKFISSNDSGRTFNLGKEISGGDLLSFSPQIAATEKGDVYVVWVDKNSTSGDSDVSLSSSHDSGLDFNNKINPSIDKNKYFRPHLNFSAQDVNQLHSKAYYFDSEKKEIKVDYIFGGRDGTFENSITNLLPIPSNTSFIKLQMWVHQNLMNDSSYILYGKRVLPTTQENLTWTNDNEDTQTISLGSNGNNSLKVDVTQGNETHWSVISTDFIPVDKVTLSTSNSPQLVQQKKVMCMWFGMIKTVLTLHPLTTIKINLVLKFL